MITKCLSPVWIRQPGLTHQKMVPCGQCYSCRRKLVRVRQGQAVAEQAFPYYPEHADYLAQHFLTFTHRDESLPMTEPRPHRLGYVLDPDTGEEKPFNGPFAKMRDTDRVTGPRRMVKDPHGVVRLEHIRSGITKRSGVPVWTETGDPLTQTELETQHERYLYERLFWSAKQIDQWLRGEYKPMPTTRIAVMQRFIAALRSWFHRNRNPEQPIRYMFASEYGGVTERPHYHMLLWGLHVKDIDQVYRIWEETLGEGHVFPHLQDAILSNATVMKGKAATYQAKDLSKSRHLFQNNPAVFDVERPKVIGSKHPPIGDGAYGYWFENWIAQIVEKAEKMFGNDEKMVIRTVLENYGLMHLPVAGRSQTFPTTPRWKQMCLSDLGISESEALAAARKETEEFNNEVDHAVKHNIGGLGDWHDERKSELQAQADENQEREARRIEEKRAKLAAAGKL